MRGWHRAAAAVALEPPAGTTAVNLLLWKPERQCHYGHVMVSDYKTSGQMSRSQLQYKKKALQLICTLDSLGFILSCKNSHSKEAKGAVNVNRRWPFGSSVSVLTSRPHAGLLVTVSSTE